MSKLIPVSYSLTDSLYPPMMLKEQLLKEGLDSGMVKDGIQYLVGAAGEYGLGTITLPAAGAGLAVGPTVETMTDSLFAMESVASTIDLIDNISGMLEEFSGLVKDAYDAYDVKNLSNYYKALTKIVQAGLKTVGKGATDAIDKVAEDLKKRIEKLIAALIRPIEQGVKLVIPEATIGTAIAKGLGQLLEQLAENAFSGVAAILKKFEMFSNFLADPEIAQDFFKSVFEQVIKLMRQGAKAIEDTSWLKKVAGVVGATVTTLGAGTIPATVLVTLGPAGIKKAADLIESHLPKILSLIDKILKVVIPYCFTCLGLFQILMKGDYKKKPKPGKKLKDHYKRNKPQLTRRQLRKFIRESYQMVLLESDTSVYEGDHDPITVEIPALQSLADTENFEGEKVWFSESKAIAIANLLEDGEPSEQDYFNPRTYEVDPEFEVIKAEYAALSNLVPNWSDMEELARNIRDAISAADEAGYNY